MIEREFVSQKLKEHYIKKFIEKTLPRVGISEIKLKKIPLGEKIIIATSKPSLVVGSKGANIKTLTKQLKHKFKLENPQVEIAEVKNLYLDAHIIADRIASSLERFGSARFKSIGHRILENVINSGAMGVEIIISGKIPGARARNWRFYQGYLKKCGDVSIAGVRKAQRSALLKSGIIGIKVAIMPPDLVLPDKIEVLDEPIQIIEEVTEEKKTKKRTTKKKATKKKTTKKKEVKKEEVIEEKKEEVKAEVPKVEAKEVKEEKIEDLKEEIKEQEEQVKGEELEGETPQKQIKAEKEFIKEEKEEIEEEPKEEKKEVLKEELKENESQ